MSFVLRHDESPLSLWNLKGELTLEEYSTSCRQDKSEDSKDLVQGRTTRDVRVMFTRYRMETHFITECHDLT